MTETTNEAVPETAGAVAGPSDVDVVSTEDQAATAGDEDVGPEVISAVERTSDIERRLSVEVPWDDVKRRLDEAYRELGLGVTVKGFRRGKVPRKMLERLFGKHVNKEVSQRLVQESIVKALAEHDLSPVAEPQVDEANIVEGESFKYVAELQVVPEIEPKDYFGIDVQQRPPRVEEPQVDEALEGKRRELTDFRPIEGRATRAGDVLLVDILGKHGDQPIDIESRLVELGDPPREPLPGLAERLTGIEPDTEELEIELSLPVHDHGPHEQCEGEHRMEAARLLVTVRERKEKLVPELDDDFAKDTGEAETLDELRTLYRERLLEADGERARDEAKQQLVGLILERNEVPVVPALVERHLDRLVKLQTALLGMQGQVDEEQLKERARGDAEQTVKSMMLVEAIAKKEGVKAEDADVDKRIEQLAAQRGQSAARVRTEYEKEGRLPVLRKSVLEEKTLDLLMSKANILIEESSDNTEQNADSAPPVNPGA